jgi:hypothetical protein
MAAQHRDPEDRDPGGRDPVGTVLARLGPRWQEVDPLLPEPSFPFEGCGQAFTVTAPSGEATAVVRLEHEVVRFHRAAEAADVAVTLLHYAQLNPRSMPFWSQQGYRPLWTLWEAHPASSLR